MKKIIFLTTVAGLTISAVQAQLKPGKFEQPVKIKTTPAPAPSPAPATNKASEPAAASVYSLTSVRVSIRTGNDNKEFPSKVLITLKTRNTPTSSWSPFSQLNLDNEMRINSNTEFGLDREAQQRGETKLEAFQREGLKLNLIYLPNFFADAWKIESLSLTLEFKDQYGNLHPTLGNKTITFSNAYGLLTNEYRYLECVTDGSFNPMTAVIRK